MPAGRPRQPIELLAAKGKKHLTKEEIKTRQESQIKVDARDVTPPCYLTKKQKEEFKKISKILLDIGIMTELDEECLAHYLVANTNYISFTKELKNLNIKLNKAKKEEKQKIMSKIDLYLIYQDRALKQCRACASDLGLSISSRCKLIMPSPRESEKENKFAKFKVVE